MDFVRHIQHKTHQDEQTWVRLGNCAGLSTSIFFPEKGESCEPAKAVCRDCPVTKECLDYAIKNNEMFGVWGGQSALERSRVRHFHRQSGWTYSEVTQ